MTITSVGYAGTVGDVEWAVLAPRAGSNVQGVDDYSSLRVAITSGTRAVSVAAGRAWSSGVLATSSAVETATLDSVPSGIRWDLVVLRYNWSTKVTSVAVVTGGSSKQLPARTNTPGTVVEQPLALCRVQAGLTAVQEVVDLRCVAGNSGLLAFDDLALSYLDRVGTSVRIRDTEWTRVVNTLGSPTWVSSDMTDTGWVQVARSPGWVPPQSGETYIPRVRRVGPTVMLKGMFKNSTSGASVLNMGTVPSLFRPTFTTTLGAYHSSGNNFGELCVTDAGTIAVLGNYYTNTLPLNSVIPLHGSWFVG